MTNSIKPATGQILDNPAGARQSYKSTMQLLAHSRCSWAAKMAAVIPCATFAEGLCHVVPCRGPVALSFDISLKNGRMRSVSSDRVASEVRSVLPRNGGLARWRITGNDRKYKCPSWYRGVRFHPGQSVPGFQRRST